MRPTAPLRYPVVNYLCPACHYPPCKTCKQDKRPHNGKYRCVWSALTGKVIDAKKGWACADCNATVECHECKCFKAKADFKLDGENKSRQKRARCLVCEFPTCHICGNASKNSVQVEAKETGPNGKRECGPWYLDIHTDALDRQTPPRPHSDPLGALTI